MSLKIVLARHGASRAYEHIDQKGVEIFRQTESTPLSQHGRTQASQLAQQISIYRPDVLLCSPYTRAKETADIVVQDNPYLFLNTIEDLREIRRIVDGKNLHGEENLAYKKWRGEVIRTKNLKGRFHPDDESHGEFFTLQTKNKRWLIEEFDDQTVLIVGHSQSFAMLIISMFYGDQPSPSIIFTFNKYFMSNCGITVMKYDNRRWNMERFNDTSHLK